MPKSVKELRGFLGLAGYYQKFIRGFGIISKPLTELLKDSFKWNQRALKAFDQLKRALCQAHVVAMTNFQCAFVLETDACSTRLGVVLSQEGRPLAFFSKALGPRHQELSIYKKEYSTILMAVDK